MTRHPSASGPPTIRGVTLRVEAPHFVAGAIFERAPDGWRCVEAAPILRWMLGKDGPAIGHYLQRRGWPYEWLRAA